MKVIKRMVCKLIGHKWDKVLFNDILSDRKIISITAVCLRCGKKNKELEPKSEVK